MAELALTCSTSPQTRCSCAVRPGRRAELPADDGKISAISARPTRAWWSTCPASEFLSSLPLGELVAMSRRENRTVASRSPVPGRRCERCCRTCASIRSCPASTEVDAALNAVNLRRHSVPAPTGCAAGITAAAGPPGQKPAEHEHRRRRRDGRRTPRTQSSG